MAEWQNYLEDGSPLIKAAELGKMRLVRLLVEGGAQVNERNQRGDTPLLASCRALRADQSENTTSLKLIHFLLQHHAEPNAQDKFGRTPLMYACMERAGAEVAAALISAGADPSMEDYAGGSALVYGINARDQETIRVLLDACRAKGRDIIIISTDLSTGDATFSQRYLNVPPSPDTSPVACMSPSDIELKTGSPNSETEAEGFFNFRASGRRGSRAASPLLLEPEQSDRQRLNSEPWLTIHNLAHLSRTYEERIAKGAVQEEEDKEVKHSSRDYLAPKVDPSSSSTAANLKPGRTFCRNHTENLVAPTEAHLNNRRNTLPALPGQNLLQLPTLSLNLSSSDTHLHDQPSTITLPPVPTSKNFHHSTINTSTCSLAPPAVQCGFNTMRKWKPQEHLCLKPQARNTPILPPLSVNCTANTSTQSCDDEESTANTEETQDHRQEGTRGKRFPRRHSIQLEQIKQDGGTDEILFIL